MTRRGNNSRTLGLNLLLTLSTGIRNRNRFLGMKRGKTGKKRGGKESAIIHGGEGMAKL